jgi:hypothetical protein
MSAQIEMAKRWMESSKKSLLATLAAMPDDKLTWCPSPTSKSALAVAAHAAISAIGISHSIAGETGGPTMTMEEIMEYSRAEEAKVTTRPQLVDLINMSSATVISALDKVTPDRLSGKVKTPFGESEMASWILVPSLHMDTHKGQIDYIQTLYGDTENHF